MKTRLNEKYLDQLWFNWNRDRGTQRFTKRYVLVNRGYDGRPFEDWLFSHGAIVKQYNKHRFIEFATDQQATWFILKYL